jgi:hypothetical protein
MFGIEDQLSRSVRIYLGYGRSSHPVRDLEALIRRFGEDRASDLQEAVEQLCAFANGQPFGDSDSLALIAKDLRIALSARYPSLSSGAVKALVWDATYNLK